MMNRRSARDDSATEHLAANPGEQVCSPDSRPHVGAQAQAVESQLIGASAAHRAMIEQLKRIAASEAPVLIEGETGSGKELAARAIHYGGPRGRGPFVPVNCGALPDTLLESELFGVHRGAFTDARESRPGLVSEAEGGTLFLDELDALTQRAQVALLRFVQDQRFRPVGCPRELSTDVRILAAVNRPLDGLVAEDCFRADLMYRLNILRLSMPPLRERGDDVELLAEHFIARFAAKYGREPLPLHATTRAWMRSHAWPGNVRELENWVHRHFLMSTGPTLECGTSDAAVIAERPASGTAEMCFAAAKAEAVRRFESEYLRRVLAASDGNVTLAAKRAGKERRAFGKLMKKYGLGARPGPG
jgi:two-component system response regulator GlrR